MISTLAQAYICGLVVGAAAPYMLNGGWPGPGERLQFALLVTIWPATALVVLVMLATEPRA